MKEIPLKKYIRYLFGIAILIFFLNKFYFRPWVLKNDASGLLLILTNSLPNLIEAIIGTLIITGILFQARQYFTKKFGLIKNIQISILTLIIIAIYVISQELKFHNLGGNNVYDPYDIAASIIGLIVTFGIIQLFGFTEYLETNIKNDNIKE